MENDEPEFDDYELEIDNDDLETVSDEPEIAFTDALNSLLSDDILAIRPLYYLSDMAEEDRLEFEGRWLATDEERRREIIRHLADISEEDFIVDFQPVFTFCLADPNPAVRIASLDGLWDTTNVRLIEPMLDMLKNDPVPEVQAAAAGALAHYLQLSAWGEVKGVPVDDIYEALLAAFQDPRSILILRRVSLEALGSVSSAEVNKAIEDSYESPERELQLSALFAMGNSADPRWLPIITDEMESPYEEVRQEAVRAAGNIGDSQSIPRLAELAYDDDEDVAQAAIEALGEIGGDQVQDILLEMSEDPDLENLDTVIMEALEDASWNTLDLQFGLFGDEFLDDEEE